MRRSNAPTLQDIATEAGVTAMTVSVVLNGSRSATRVSEATRLRIQEVASRLRYRPNAVARGLSRRRMDTIGVALTIDVTDINLYFLELLNGILEQCALKGQNTTVFSVSDWSDEQRILQFCDGRVDGVILISPRLSPGLAAALQERTPFVTIHSDDTLPNTVNLDLDNEAASFAAVSYLIERGHRRIMHLAGELERRLTQKRLRGYSRALEAFGIDYDETLVVHSRYSQAAGLETMRALLGSDRLSLLPTAIFCANDALAFGCMDALAEFGVRVPADVSVMGFDDSLLARMTTPPLTTVRQPLREIGSRSVDLLLELTQDDKPYTVINPIPVDLARTELIDFTITLRDSVGQPPQSPVVPSGARPVSERSIREIRRYN